MSLKEFVNPIISKYSDAKDIFFLSFRMLLIQGSQHGNNLHKHLPILL